MGIPIAVLLMTCGKVNTFLYYDVIVYRRLYHKQLLYYKMTTLLQLHHLFIDSCDVAIRIETNITMLHSRNLPN